MRFDSVLFDLDGTLWDATRTVCKSWQQAAEAFRPGLGKQVTHEAVCRNMGKLLPDIFLDLFPDLSGADRQILLELAGQTEIEVVAREGGILYPHLAETLAVLKKHCRLYIVSNCQDGYIPAFFHAHGLERFFDGIEYAGRTGLSKGENIALVLQRDGLSHGIYVGDTQGDADAADFAGIPFIHAAYGFGTVDHPVPRLDAISQLPDLLAQLEQE